MYLKRNSSPEFDQLQFNLREYKLSLAPGVKVGLPGIIEKLDAIIETTKEICLIIADTFDEPYFRFQECFFAVAKFQTTYLQSLKSGDGKAEAFKQANQFNLKHLAELSSKLDQSRPSVEASLKLADEISASNQLTDFYTKIDELAIISMPFVHGIETNPYAHFQRHISTPDIEEKKEAEPLMLSVQFSTDNEPWANPQILKPQTQYTINGVIKLNRLPDNYSKLIIRHVSTTSDDFFVLSLPEIQLTNELSYSIMGQVIFKYPQNTFDPPVAIKLMAQLLSPSAEPIYPHLIGYDELITQIIDENTFKYPTGFSKLNKRAWDIGLEIKKDLPHIDNNELDHFIILLSGILNYAGYCALHGIFKKVSNLSEDDFRDRLIAYLSANPMIGGDIIKEGHIAGGRVEIRYQDVIAELKVEKTMSDRAKMVDQYKRQPSVYASAVSADLAILCILDLTDKTLPSASVANNVFTIPAVFHGFATAPTTSKIAVIIIDGNLKNPSAY